MSGPTPVTEEEVETFLTKLKAADNDKKVDLIQFFSLKIEATAQLPETTFDALTLSIAPLIKTSSHLLLSSVLVSFLPFYLPLLPSSSPPTQSLRTAVSHCLPLLLERLNDPKDRVFSPAAKCIAILGRKSYESEPTGPVQIKGKEKEGLVAFWERNVKETMGGKGKGWRGKVEGMKLLEAMRVEEGSRLSLKPWLATLADLLEDSDNHVRDQAKETVVALLAPASTPAAARVEFKKLLGAKNVRKGIADSIMSRIFNTTSGRSTPAPDAHAGDDGSSAGGGGLRSGAVTPAGDDVAIVHIASGRDLEGEFSKMLPYFQGKENEHNWANREASVVRLRGMLRGQAFNHFPDAFVLGLKAGILDGVTKTLLSLRTTVAQQSCLATEELAEYLGSALDPFVEGLLPVMGKMAGFTKKMIADRSQKSATAIITHSTCHPRLYISHIHAGMNEKNIQTRQYSAGHLKTFLDAQAPRSRHAIESTPGLLEQVDECVKKSLHDVNPQVRELGRAAYWSYQAIWPSRANEIMRSLDGMAKKQLEKADPKLSATIKTVPAPAPVPPKPKQRVSAISALLAEKRKVKASETGSVGIGDSPRVWPTPGPDSPGMKIMNGLTSPTPAGPSRPMPTMPTSPQSPTSPRSPPAGMSGIPRYMGSPPAKNAGSRSSSLGHARSVSPPSSHGSPKASLSQAKASAQASFPPISDPMSPGLSDASEPPPMQTPQFPRPPLPDFAKSPVGLFSPDQGQVEPRPTTRSLAEADLKAQAAQAVSSAQRLLDFESGKKHDPPLTTPARPPAPTLNGLASSSSLRTPANMFLNGNGFKTPATPVWADSPRPEALTPMMLSKLQERKHEKSWWLKRRQLMDRATPFQSSSSDSAETIQSDVEALQRGQPSAENLQRIALFAGSHPVQSTESGAPATSTGVWNEDGLFVNVFDGLMRFLGPKRDIDLLEHALVLLWEMVQHQWSLFEDRDDDLVDALFRLRASRNNTIVESTNSLISLLVEISDPLYFLSVLSGALDRFLHSHPISMPNGNGLSNGGTTAPADLVRIRASGELFGLTGIGLCILRLPREVVEIEGARLAPLVMDALTSTVVTTRQAANTLILAIQVVMGDSNATLALFPELNAAQKNLAHYLMEKNGLLQKPKPTEDEETRKVHVEGEMANLLGRGVRG